jgi:hypothetical protein
MTLNLILKFSNRGLGPHGGSSSKLGLARCRETLIPIADHCKRYMLSTLLFSLSIGKPSPVLERNTLEKHFSFSVRKMLLLGKFLRHTGKIVAFI